MEEEVYNEVQVREMNNEAETAERQIKRSFFDRYVDKIKDFLDNAE